MRSFPASREQSRWAEANLINLIAQPTAFAGTAVLYYSGEATVKHGVPISPHSSTGSTATPERASSLNLIEPAEPQLLLRGVSRPARKRR